MGPSDVTGVILAGGQGRRMQGRDKGLVELDGTPMVAHVLGRLRAQVASMLIVANRNQDRYRAFGIEVVGDELPGYQGPLAGIAAGLAAARTPLVQIAPCDAPRLPPDLVERLRRAMTDNAVPAVYAVDERGAYPVICLLERALLEPLVRDLHAGLRQVKAWLTRVGSTAVSFADQPGTLVNINTPSALRALASR